MISAIFPNTSRISSSAPGSVRASIVCRRVRMFPVQPEVLRHPALKLLHLAEQCGSPLHQLRVLPGPVRDPERDLVQPDEPQRLLRHRRAGTVPDKFMSVPRDYGFSVTPDEQQAIGDPDTMNTALVVLDTVVMAFLVPVPAPHCGPAGVIDQWRQAARNEGNHVAWAQVTEALAVRHGALEARTVVDPYVRGPARCDREHLQIVRHLRGRRINNS